MQNLLLLLAKTFLLFATTLKNKFESFAVSQKIVTFSRYFCLKFVKINKEVHLHQRKNKNSFNTIKVKFTDFLRSAVNLAKFNLLSIVTPKSLNLSTTLTAMLPIEISFGKLMS